MMEIAQKFTFGKYKGLSVIEVFQGNDNINPLLIRDFLITKLTEEYSPQKFYDREIFFMIDFFEYEISEKEIRLQPKLKKFDGMDFSTLLEKLFSDNLGLEYLFPTLNDFNLETFSIGKEKPEITSGNPNYINWCIRKIEKFYLNPNQFAELMSQNVYLFMGVKVFHIKDNVYEYKPNIVIQNYRNTDNIIEENRKKFLEFEKQKMTYYNDEDNSVDGYDADNCCPACQESPCMCSDPFRF